MGEKKKDNDVHILVVGHSWVVGMFYGICKQSGGAKCTINEVNFSFSMERGDKTFVFEVIGITGANISRIIEEVANKDLSDYDVIGIFVGANDIEANSNPLVTFINKSAIQGIIRYCIRRRKAIRSLC